MVLKIITLYILFNTIVTTYLAFYLFHKGKSLYANVLAILILMVFAYEFAYLAELNSLTVSSALFWADIEYLFIPLLNSTWLVLCLIYTGKINAFIHRLTAVIYIIPLITIVIRLTNDYHGLFYYDPEMVHFSCFWLLSSGRGIWYYVHIGYVLFATLLSVIIFTSMSIKSSGSEMCKYVVMVIATLLPIGAVLFGLWDPFNLPIDYPALVLPVSVLILALSIIMTDYLGLKSAVMMDLYQSNQIGILILARNGIIVDVNQLGASFLADRGIHLKKNGINTLHTIDKQSHEMQQAIASKEPRYIYFNEEAQTYLELKTETVYGRRGKVIGYIKFIKDITAKTKSRIRLEALSKTDELSSLANRRELTEQGERWLQENHGKVNHVALLFIDIDHFKTVNDTYGHHTGDEVIKNLAHLLKNKFRSMDLIARYGGEEFIVMILIENDEEAERLAWRLVREVQETSLIPSHEDQIITVSVGVAIAQAEDQLQSLIDRGDEAMYQAKMNGRNQVVSHKKMKFI